MLESVWIVNAYPLFPLRVFASYGKAKQYYEDIINHRLQDNLYHVEFDEIDQRYKVSSFDHSRTYILTIKEFKVE